MESLIGEVFESFCPHCDKFTTHEWVEDNLFEYAAVCITCETVWQMENPDAS